MSKRSSPLDATDSPSIRLIPNAAPTVPVLTDREWRCVAWLVAGLAWIPDAWTDEIGSLAKKLRAFLGDDVVKADVKPPEREP